jgi:hypothetical protein
LPSHDNGACPCVARGRRDLGIADLAMVILEGSEEGVHRSKSPITVDLRAEGVVDPRAEALCPAGGYNLLARGNEIRVDGGRQSLFRAHTNMLRHDHDGGQPIRRWTSSQPRRPLGTQVRSATKDGEAETQSETAAQSGEKLVDLLVEPTGRGKRAGAADALRGKGRGQTAMRSVS